MSTIRNAADSTFVVVTARAAMFVTPFLFGAAVYFGGQWLDGRFDKISDAAAAASLAASDAANTADSAKDKAATVASDVAVIKATQADNAATQAHIARQVDKLTDVATTTSIQVSAISATLDSMRSTGPIGSLDHVR